MNTKGVQKARRFKSKGFTIYQIAKKLGVPYQYVQRWLSYRLPWEKVDVDK